MMFLRKPRAPNIKRIMIERFQLDMMYRMPHSVSDVAARLREYWTRVLCDENLVIGRVSQVRRKS